MGRSGLIISDSAGGENYNSADLLPGVTDCKLVEVSERRSGAASYVVSISTTEKLKEDEQMCVFFKDLMADPNGDGIEGILKKEETTF